MDNYCRFNFIKCPELKEKYETYHTLRLEVVRWSTKNGVIANKKFEKAQTDLQQYEYNVLAKAIFDTFSKIKPILHRRRGEETYHRWDDVFDCPFEENDINKRKCLIGLLEGKFVYELPLEYYIR